MKRFGYLLFTIPVCLALYIFTNTSAAPYQHNWWKSHRWSSQVKLPLNQTFSAIIVALPGEEAEFEICLEHGELRRTK